MKNKISLLIFAYLTPSVIFLSSCTPIVEGCTDSRAVNYNSRATEDNGSCIYCSGKGTLSLTNSSALTQKINIDGANYGYLYAGNTAHYQLAAGPHTYTFLNGTGTGNACGSATVIIVECQTIGFFCAG